MTRAALKAYREHLGLTQDDVAQRVGVSSTYISHAERVEPFRPRIRAVLAEAARRQGDMATEEARASVVDQMWALHGNSGFGCMVRHTLREVIFDLLDAYQFELGDKLLAALSTDDARALLDEYFEDEDTDR